MELLNEKTYCIFPVKNEYISKLRQTTNIILGENEYEALHSMFRSILYFKCKEYDYIMLVTRRSYILFKIFAAIIFEEEREQDKKEDLIENEKKIVNDIYLCSISNELAGKRILIVDDILVKGKNVKLNLERFAEWNIRPQDIGIFLYVYDRKEEKVFDREAYGSLECKFMKYPEERIEISNKLVKLILATCLSYSSYVFGAYYYDNIADKYEKLTSLSGDVIKYTDMTETKENLYIFPAHLHQMDSFFNIFADVCVLRANVVRSAEAMSVVPFVFLKKMRKLDVKNDQECKNIMSKFLDIVFGESGYGDHIRRVFLKEDTDCYRYKARLLNCLLSYLYGLICAQQLDMLQIYESFDFKVVEKSFGSLVADDFRELDNDFAIGFVNRWNEFQKEGNITQFLSGITKENHEENKELLPKLEKTIHNVMEQTLRAEGSFQNVNYNEVVREIIKEYFIESGNLGRTVTKKLDGLSTQCIVETIFKNLEEISKQKNLTFLTSGKDKYNIIYASLLHSWDIGESSGHFSSESEFTVTVHTHGEQNLISGLWKYKNEIIELQKIMYVLYRQTMLNKNVRDDYDSIRESCYKDYFSLKAGENKSAETFIREHMDIIERIDFDKLV